MISRLSSREAEKRNNVRVIKFIWRPLGRMASERQSKAFEEAIQMFCEEIGKKHSKDFERPCSEEPISEKGPPYRGAKSSGTNNRKHSPWDDHQAQQKTQQTDIALYYYCHKNWLIERTQTVHFKFLQQIVVFWAQEGHQHWLTIRHQYLKQFLVLKRT